MTPQISKDDLELIWNALEFYRSEGIPEHANDDDWDKEWNDICTVMAWISEDHGIDQLDGEDA